MRRAASFFMDPRDEPEDDGAAVDQAVPTVSNMQAAMASLGGLALQEEVERGDRSGPPLSTAVSIIEAACARVGRSPVGSGMAWRNTSLAVLRPHLEVAKPDPLVDHRKPVRRRRSARLDLAIAQVERQAKLQAIRLRPPSEPQLVILPVAGQGEGQIAVLGAVERRDSRRSAHARPRPSGSTPRFRHLRT